MTEIFLTEAESRAVQVVDHNLRVIEETWGRGAQPSAVYQHAVVLRVLLVHNELSRAWGKVWPAEERPPLTVVAPDLQSIVTEARLPHVVHAQSAGLAMPGIHLWMPVALRDTMPESPDQPPARSAVPVGDSVEFRLKGGILSGLIDQGAVPLKPPSCYRRYKLKQFMAAPCMVSDGRWISRETLVNDFVNQFGGAHLSWSDTDSKYRDLTDSGRWMRIRGRSPAVFELLSIGQIVVRSESVRLFRERVQQLELEPLL